MLPQNHFCARNDFGMEGIRIEFEFDNQEILHDWYLL